MLLLKTKDMVFENFFKYQFSYKKFNIKIKIGFIYSKNVYYIVKKKIFNDNMKNNKHSLIKVAILAEEPLGWGSGKHFFPIILDGYKWKKADTSYEITTKYIYDKDIINKKLNTKNFDVLLVPGGGVGDGHAVMKGFKNLRKVKKWKKQIQEFIKNGGGYIGICGGAALFTNLVTDPNKKVSSIMEKLYNSSSLELSSIKHFYKDLAFPLLYPHQKKYPEKIGATAYIFSFSPGVTKDGKRIHTGGVPVDFVVSKDNPIFKDYNKDTIRIRWWGGPGLILPKDSDREIKVLVHYPKLDISENKATRIYLWIYKGGIIGLIKAFFEGLKLIHKNKERLSNFLFYTYYLAKPWRRSEKILTLDFSNKPSITTEIYPNQNKGRIVLCTSHPEYMIWWGGHIEEVKEDKKNCIAYGFHQWKDINPLSKSVVDELTYTWWIVRRMTAWAAKISDKDLPPIEKEEINEKIKILLKQNIFWDGTITNQMKNI
jgi:putative intracellular protease/amidase